jgi:hypothetical protein
MNPVIIVRTTLLLVPCTVLGAPSNADIEGAWKCGPYEMQGSEFVIVATDRPTYSSDGKFTEVGIATYTDSDGSSVRMETRLTGNWMLIKDIIEIHFTSAEFVSSDSPAFPVAKGQASLDAQMKRKNWGKKRVLSYGEKLVTVPVEALNKQAEVQVSCSKA